MNHCFARRSKTNFVLSELSGAVSKLPDRLEPLGGFADKSLLTPFLIDEIQQLRRGPRVA